jgi:beta-ureidopropionase / N-carbamoyl-L-amino-acid hydrolase
MTDALVARAGVLELDIDADRLLRRIAELARIGADHTTGGITREGFSAADRRARAYLMDEARAAGLVPAVDAAGNIIVRRDGSTAATGTATTTTTEAAATAANTATTATTATTGPGAGTAAATAPAPEAGQVVMMGSHLDTVVNAGRLDGAYGVLAALEVLQAVAESDLRYEPVVTAFANEEGALFPQPFWGSMALAGRLADLPREPGDHDGRPLREALRLAGGDLDALGSASWPRGSVASYLELHVEQGPVLERAGDRIGVVDAITGRIVLTVEIRGAAGHSGTTPMEGRRDALAAAARVVLAAESIARDRDLCRVATVGRIAPHPNTPNTIAGTVRMTVDLRDTVPRRAAAAEAALREELRAIAGGTGTEIEVVAETRSDPVDTHPLLREAIAGSAEELGLPYEVLPSGAGHDAQMVADIAPIGMIFVPSRGGVSHVPEEDTADDDLVAGARVLLRTVLRIAGRSTEESGRPVGYSVDGR